MVLTGSVINPIDANRAAEIASRYAKKKDAVVNMLSVGAKEQVLLKVQVAEMQRDAIRRLGVNVPAAVLNSGNITFTKVIQNAFPVTAAIVPEAIAGALGPDAVAGAASQTTWTGGANTVTALVQALERAGLIRTLAEPNLTAISGETAKFLAGGEFPIPDRRARTGRSRSRGRPSACNVSFKPVVLSGGPHQPRTSPPR